MENREIKFRAWKKTNTPEMFNNVLAVDWYNNEIKVEYDDYRIDKDVLSDFVLMQYAGLKDKNGVEIYEYSELDGTYEVVFKDLKYRLRHISNNRVIDLHDYWRGKNGEIEVTREYTKV